MSHDTFIDLVRLTQLAHADARETAIFLAGPILLVAVLLGLLLALWIFRGGLSRSLWCKNRVR